MRPVESRKKKGHAKYKQDISNTRPMGTFLKQFHSKDHT
jgi:hypothetical protein